MLGFVNLHRFAAARGDGLRPELLELLVTQQRMRADARVFDIGDLREDGWAQSGPHPAGTLDATAMAPNVIAFTARPAPARLTLRSR